MTKKYRSYTRSKTIVASDMSGQLPRIFRFSSFKQASDFLKVSPYRLRKIAEGELDDDYIRGEDGTLYHIALDYKYVVHARPEDYNMQEINFTSAYKCIQYFGISSDTYYRRANESLLEVENPKPIKDKQGDKWFLTFLTPVKDKFEYKTKEKKDGTAEN